MGLNAKTIPPERLQATRDRFIAGWGGYPLIGTKEQIVDGLKFLSDMELDGILLCWADYLGGISEYQRETYPLLVETGLR